MNRSSYILCEIIQALRQLKKLPYTFIYLVAFFLLADVSFGNCSEFKDIDQFEGPQYDWDSRFYLSKRQIFILLLAKHILGLVSGDNVDYQVRYELRLVSFLELDVFFVARLVFGISKNTGKFVQSEWYAWSLTYSFVSSRIFKKVYRHKCRNNSHSTLTRSWSITINVVFKLN